jgi:hypothetical protein
MKMERLILWRIHAAQPVRVRHGIKVDKLTGPTGDDRKYIVAGVVFKVATTGQGNSVERGAIRAGACYGFDVHDGINTRRSLKRP